MSIDVYADAGYAEVAYQTDTLIIAVSAYYKPRVYAQLNVAAGPRSGCLVLIVGGFGFSLDYSRGDIVV
jgi:hypothetical protein